MKSLAKPARLYQKPPLKSPYMVAAWPGIGNAGLTSANYLKGKLGAIEFGEIEPHYFFLPRRVFIKNGLLQGLEFPSNKFYYKKGERDLIIFLGEMQPNGDREMYEMANSVLDVAEYFGVKRVYTAGAALAPIDHAGRSRVWAVPNSDKLIGELKKHDVVLMSEIEGRAGRGNITGLNGMLLGVARKRNLEGVCFLGEVPVYVANFPVLYPKASRSILNVLTESLGVRIDMTELDSLVEQAERGIEKLYMALPPEVREQLDRFRAIAQAEAAKQKIMKDIEEFFMKGGEAQT